MRRLPVPRGVRGARRGPGRDLAACSPAAGPRRIAVALELGAADAAVLEHVPRAWRCRRDAELVLLHVAESAASRYLGPETLGRGEPRGPRGARAAGGRAARPSGSEVAVALGNGDVKTELARLVGEWRRRPADHRLARPPAARRPVPRLDHLGAAPPRALPGADHPLAPAERAGPRPRERGTPARPPFGASPRARRRLRAVSERIHFGRLTGTVADVLDAGLELLPDFELAAIPVLDGTDRPGEWPAMRRRLRAEGIRCAQHRGVLLLPPGELDQCASVGLFRGIDEIYLCAEWNDEFEAFPGRITTDLSDFSEATPLGLEDWMLDAGCLLALGDGDGLNFATLDPEIAERLRARFRPARGRMSCEGASRLVALESRRARRAARGAAAGVRQRAARLRRAGLPPAPALRRHPAQQGRAPRGLHAARAGRRHAALQLPRRGQERGPLRPRRAASWRTRARRSAGCARACPARRSLVAGFSFGSWVAARLAASEPAVERLVLVAPPVAGADFAVLRTAPVPKLVVQGTADEICPLSALEPEFATWAEPRRLETVEGATHFFDRRLGELAKALLEGLAGSSP